MKIIIPTSSPIKATVDPDFHNRTILAIGKEIIESLGPLVICIAGLGGLGMLIAELLARLGITNFILSDFDPVDYSNLNRLTGATKIDAMLKIPKTALAARLIYGINPNAKIRIVDGDILTEECQNQLLGSDVLFGCSDSIGVRKALNILCLSRGIPYYDLGCGVKVENTKMTACGGQVIRILPGRNYCIECCGLFDLRKADADLMSPEEAKRQREQGYVENVYIPEPSVYALNMMVASQAVWWFLRTMAGEKLDYDGIYIDGLTFQTYPWTEETKRNEKGINKCPACGVNGVTFGGDEVDLLVRKPEKHEGIPQNNSKSNTQVIPKESPFQDTVQSTSRHEQITSNESLKHDKSASTCSSNVNQENPEQLPISLSISAVLSQSKPNIY